MRIFEAMSQQVRTVPGDMPVREAYALMKTKGIHHLVVTGEGAVVGVLSDRDISPRRRTPTVPEGVRVSDLMASPVVTINRDETVKKAANLMQGRTIGCLPVMDNGRLVGIITTADLLRLIGTGIDRPPHYARATLSHKVPHKKLRVGSGRW